MIHLAPGEPVDLQTGEMNVQADVKQKQILRELYGLDQPLHVQYFRWLNRLIRLDFGRSFAADGRPVRPKVERFEAGGMPATLVELTGRYARQLGMSAGAEAKPGQTLLAAVVESPEGNLTFQLHGDQATVEQHRKGFVAMVKGLKRR